MVSVLKKIPLRKAVREKGKSLCVVAAGVRESPFPQILIGYHDLIALPRHPPLYGIIPHPPRHLLLGIVKCYQSCTGSPRAEVSGDWHP